MTSPFLIVVPTIVVIAVVIFVVTGLMSRGKKLKCPDCGTVFPAPMMDEKGVTVGFTFPYTGQLTCPKCKARHSRREYLKAAASSASP